MGVRAVVRVDGVFSSCVLGLLVFGLVWACGASPEEVARDYGISVEDVRAALLYAACLLDREEVDVV